MAVYSQPLLYQRAFAYRDIERECDFLLELAAKFSRLEPTSFLELAAGPADHALEFARRGVRSTALDLSREMIAFASQRSRQLGVELGVVCADMVSFVLAEPTHLAACMLNSIAHLHTDAA